MINQNIIPFYFMGFVIIAILMIVLMIRGVGTRARRKYIIPKLKGKNLKLISYKWMGFTTGNDDRFSFSGLMVSRGSPFLSCYYDIIYKEGNIDKKVSVKVDTVFLMIKKVSYSHEI